MTTVRSRFAPSPTGYLHIGGARTALFAYLHAKQQNGTFLLRIDDTDRQRSTQEYLDEIMDAMHWLGLAMGRRSILSNPTVRRCIKKPPNVCCVRAKPTVVIARQKKLRPNAKPRMAAGTETCI